MCRYVGGGCFRLSEGSSSGSGVGGGAAPTYSIVHEGLDGGVLVTVSGANGETLAQRGFSEDFLYSDAVDELAVELDGGSLRLLHWGGDECDPIRDPDVE